MSYETLDPCAEGAEANRCSQTTGTGNSLARSYATVGLRIRSVRAPGISISADGFAARSSYRTRRGHRAGHIEASAERSWGVAEVCQKQWNDDGRGRDERTAGVSPKREDAWLSRVPKAASSTSILTMSLTACSSRSSRKPMRFWFPLGSGLWRR